MSGDVSCCTVGGTAHGRHALTIPVVGAALHSPLWCTGQPHYKQSGPNIQALRLHSLVAGGGPAGRGSTLQRSRLIKREAAGAGLQPATGLVRVTALPHTTGGGHPPPGDEVGRRAWKNAWHITSAGLASAVLGLLHAVRGVDVHCSNSHLLTLAQEAQQCHRPGQHLAVALGHSSKKHNLTRPCPKQEERRWQRAPLPCPLPIISTGQTPARLAAP